MKKFLLSLFVAFAFTTLVACNGEESSDAAGQQNSSSSGEGSSTGTEQQTGPESVTIEYWHSHGDTQIDALNEMIEGFESENPHITVDAVFQGGYGDLEQNLLAALAAGNVPAVSILESASVPHFADGEVVADLNDYLDRDGIDKSDFSIGMMNSYQFNDMQAALPLIVSASVFVYNQDLFDELGVEAPTTWEELDEFGETVAQANVVDYPFAIPGWSAWYYDPWIINAGGSIIQDDGTSGIHLEESKKYLHKFQEWHEAGHMFLPYGQGSSGEMRQMFLDGNIAMIEHTSSLINWYIENADFEIGVAFIPGDVERTTMIGGAGILLMDGAPEEEKEAGWEFIKYMTSAEQNIAWNSGTGYLPTRRSAIESEEGQTWLEEFPQYRDVLEMFDYVNPRIQHPGYSEFRDFYEEVVGRIALEGGDVDELLDAASERVDEVLQEYVR